MSSTTALGSPGHPTRRKFLKRPDEFVSAVKNLFDWSANHSRQMLMIFVVLTATLAAGALYIQHRGTKAREGMSALYLADKILTEEMKPFSPPVAEDKKAAAPAASADFLKLDVDAKLPKSVQAYKDVINKFYGTRAAYEARMELGNLYFHHGEAAKAVIWYEGAVTAANDNQSRALALYSLAHSQEGSKRTPPVNGAYDSPGKIRSWEMENARVAAATYEKALAQGGVGIKGDILLGIARTYEEAEDFSKARSAYDQVLSQLPNTEYSRLAEVYRAKLRDPLK